MNLPKILFLVSLLSYFFACKAEKEAAKEETQKLEDTLQERNAMKIATIQSPELVEGQHLTVRGLKNQMNIIVKYNDINKNYDNYIKHKEEEIYLDSTINYLFFRLSEGNQLLLWEDIYYGGANSKKYSSGIYFYREGLKEMYFFGGFDIKAYKYLDWYYIAYQHYHKEYLYDANYIITSGNKLYRSKTKIE